LALKPHAGSDRAFTYFTPVLQQRARIFISGASVCSLLRILSLRHVVQDWSEDPETGKVEQQNELFAFRFANPENAAKFKEAFENCQKGASDDMPVMKQDAEDAEKVRASS